MEPALAARGQALSPRVTIVLLSLFGETSSKIFKNFIFRCSILNWSNSSIHHYGGYFIAYNIFHMQVNYSLKDEHMDFPGVSDFRRIRPTRGI